MINILVIGAAGQLGSEIRDLEFDFRDTCVFYYADISGGEFIELDITDKTAIQRVLSDNKIDAVINCAAYTAVDRAETDMALAYAVNSVGAGNLAACVKNINATLIHISTDYVFDGKASQPYTEKSPVNPAGIYGKSKLEGESAIKESGCKGVIIRTSWLYSAFGANFVKTMIRLGRQSNEIGVVADQHGSPTYAADLARAIMGILPKLIENPKYADIYHFSNRGETTWFEFASLIMRLAELDCEVKPLTTEQYPTPAPRPAYSVMDTSRITSDFGIVPSQWEASLEKCIKLILAQ